MNGRVDKAQIMTNIMTLISGETGNTYHKKTDTEWAGACPFCGGKDRCYINTAENRFFCRKCRPSGDDAIQFIRDYKGLSFEDAKKYLGLNGNSAPVSIPKTEQPQKPTAKAGKTEYFIRQWNNAVEYVRKHGLPAEVSEYFRKRGFSDKILEYLLSKGLIGYLPNDLYSQQGQTPKIYKPSVVFPLFDAKTASRIVAIQRIFPAGGKKSLGPVRDGIFFSDPEPFKNGNPGKYTAHESIFDALSVYDATEGKQNAVAIMSAGETLKLRNLPGTPIAFFDNPNRDNAGLRAGENFILEMKGEIGIITYDGVQEKDANELLQAGKKAEIIRMIDEADMITGENRPEHRQEELEQREKQNAAAEAIKQDEQITLITFGELLEMEIEFSPLIDGLLGPKESLLICGPSGIGKSLFLNLFMLSCACPDIIPKGMFDLFPVTRPLKSLLIQSENTAYATKSRLRDLISVRPELRAGVENIIIPKIKDDCRMSGDFEDDSFQKKILEMLTATGADLLVIDPLISFHNRDENDNPGMRKFLDQITVLCDEAEISFVGMHHSGKNGGRNGTFSGRGASAIGDWSANTLILEKFYPGKETYGPTPFIQVHHEKSRNFRQVEPFFLERTESLDFMRIEKPTAKDDRVSEIVLNALTQIGGEAESQGELEREIIQQEKCSRSTSQNIIKAAISRKIIMPIPRKGKKIGIRPYKK